MLLILNRCLSESGLLFLLEKPSNRVNLDLISNVVSQNTQTIASNFIYNDDDDNSLFFKFKLKASSFHSFHANEKNLTNTKSCKWDNTVLR